MHWIPLKDASVQLEGHGVCLYLFHKGFSRSTMDRSQRPGYLLPSFCALVYICYGQGDLGGTEENCSLGKYLPSNTSNLQQEKTTLTPRWASW